ncbi:hypothetical protein SD77_1789 [Bacillus badius]|uniref:Mobile element protein n=1 Tax=Bacillus badius TaxID=1455 RepID=A0ABR5AQM4_BACBA|nr:hypothetical protein SD77_1789 [Bacillus badius]
MKADRGSSFIKLLFKSLKNKSRTILLQEAHFLLKNMIISLENSNSLYQ